MNPVSVTDHTLIRYLERVHGFDGGPIRAAIAADVEKAAGVAVGQGLARNYAVQAGGVRYLLSGVVVVTVLGTTLAPPNLHRRTP